MRWPRRIAEHVLTATVVFCLTTTGRLVLVFEPLVVSPYGLTHPVSSTSPTTQSSTNSAVIDKTGRTDNGLGQSPYNDLGRLDRPTTFLLGIFTVKEDIKARQRTRDTMLGKDLPSSVRERLCSLNVYLEAGVNTDRCQIIYAFVIGANENGPMEYDDGMPWLVEPPVLKDEPDVIHLNIQENMNRGKTPSWFDYASHALVPQGIDYVSKIDLDTLVSIPQLLQFVNEELPQRSEPPPRVYGGILMDFEACGGKWWPAKCDPVKGKAYMSGQFYFLSYDIVQYVSARRADKTFKERKIEDLALAIRIWAYPHPIKLMAMNPSYFWVHGLKNDTLWHEQYHNVSFRENWSIHSTHFVNGLYKPQ